MGRRKITIQQITDPKLRNITYNKRKNGLIKKAAEISLLCGINLMLVFEDLNGTLVQFSRNKIKSIGSFPKECTYKRVLELTAEDYPNFSPIKRHKKNQENVEEKKFQVPKLNGKHGARCAEEMISEHESPMTKEEEVFSTDNDAMSGYTTGLNMVTESPETNFSEDYQAVYPRESNHVQPERLKKAFKTTATSQVSIPVKSPNPKELKNRPKLRLNIPKTDDNNKDTMKVDSVGKVGSANSKKQLSSQKTYTRKPTFDITSKPLNLMSPFPFLGLDAQNHQLNIRLANLINSPYKEAVNQRKAASFVNFPGEEDHNGPNFTDYSPFTFQAIGATPPTLKQQRPMGDDHFSTDKIVNYLSHPGRSPPQQQTGVFNFQQAELYNGPSYDHNNICGLETELASTRKNNNPFWDFPYNGKESCGKLDNGLPSAGLSGYKFNFDGYSFGNDTGIKDWGEAIRRMKMV